MAPKSFVLAICLVFIAAVFPQNAKAANSGNINLTENYGPEYAKTQEYIEGILEEYENYGTVKGYKPGELIDFSGVSADTFSDENWTALVFANCVSQMTKAGKFNENQVNTTMKYISDKKYKNYQDKINKTETSVKTYFNRLGLYTKLEKQKEAGPQYIEKIKREYYTPYGITMDDKKQASLPYQTPHYNGTSGSVKLKYTYPVTNTYTPLSEASAPIQRRHIQRRTPSSTGAFGSLNTRNTYSVTNTPLSKQNSGVQSPIAGMYLTKRPLVHLTSLTTNSTRLNTLKQREVVRGLENVGNSCYFNALMQVLNASNTFRTIISDISRNGTGNAKKLADVMIKLFNEMSTKNSTTSTSYSPTKEFEEISKVLENYAMDDQNDMDTWILTTINKRGIGAAEIGKRSISAAEIGKRSISAADLAQKKLELYKLIKEKKTQYNSLKDELAKLGIKGYDTYLTSSLKFAVDMQFKVQQDSSELLQYVLNVFGHVAGNPLSRLTATITPYKTCRLCNLTIKQDSEQAPVLTLSADESNTLESLLTQYPEKNETNGVPCCACSRFNATIKPTIEKWPDTLIVKLNRVSFTENGFKKTNDPIQYPINLTAGRNAYKLKGVVCHGGTAYSGHYTAYVIGPMGQWYYISDSVVKQTEYTEVLSKKTAADLLIYEK